MNTRNIHKSFVRIFGAILPGACFLTIVPLLLHIAFSWMGFNPGAHGSILAASRRILEGQVPWRDFYAWHAPLSYFLHLPLVLLGGDRVFWLARLVVWFELSVVAWLFSCAFCRVWKLAPRVTARVLVALIILPVSAHNFPLDLSSSLDAMFFLAIGAYMLCSGHKHLKCPAWLAFGLATVCKPGFALPGVVALMLFNDWRNVWCWVALFAPALLTVLTLACSGTLYVAWQCLAPLESFGSAFASIRFSRTAFILAGYLGMRFLHGSPSLQYPRWLLQPAAWLLLLVWPFYFTLKGVALGTFGPAAYSLFWLAAGVFAYIMIDYREVDSCKKGLVFISLAVSFTVATDYSYALPALGAGMLLVSSFVWLIDLVPPKTRLCITAVMAASVLLAMNKGRNEHAFRERPSEHLDKPLCMVFRGGTGILVNRNVYTFLADFEKSAETVRDGDRPYAVIPEMAAYWVGASQLNPMPSDSMLLPRGISTNLSNTILTDAYERTRELVVVAQKTRSTQLDRGFRRYRGHSVRVIRYLTGDLEKTSETAYFEVYKRK